MSPRPPVSAASGSGDDEVLIAVRAIGQPAAVAIIRFLSDHEGARTAEILDATGLQRATLTRYLRELRDLQVIHAAGEAGAVPRYSVNRVEVERITRDHLDYMLGRPLRADPDE